MGGGGGRVETLIPPVSRVRFDLLVFPLVGRKRRWDRYTFDSVP